MRVPAICDACAAIFPSGYEADNCTNISFTNCASGPCPQCGGMGHVPDGVYNFIGNTIELLSGPSKTISQLNRIAEIIGNAKNSKMSYQEVVSEIDKNAPELSSLKEFLPKTRNELYAFLALIVSIIALIITQQTTQTTTNIEINNVINNVYQQNNSIKINTKNETTRKKTGRNEPCHCNSGKKYKKCCLTNT
jgi:SEC-C motif